MAGRHVEMLDQSRTRRRSVRFVDHAEAADRGEMRQRNVGPDDWVRTRPCFRRSSGMSARPRSTEAVGLGARYGSPPIRISPATQRVGAEDGAQRLAAAAADEADQADDLARADGERHVVQAGVGREVLRRRGAAAASRIGRRRDRREGDVGRLAEHRLDQARFGLVRDLRRAHHRAVAHHGDAVGGRQRMVEEMGDVDDRCVPSAASRAITSCSRAASSAVSDEVGSSMMMTRASRAMARMISTFCRSAMRSARTAALRIEAEAAAPVELAEAIDLGAAQSTPAAVVLDAEKDVVGDRQRRHQLQLLMDHGDAALQRPPRRPAVRPPRRRSRAAGIDV